MKNYLAVLLHGIGCSTTPPSEIARDFPHACAPQACEAGPVATEAAHVDAVIDSVAVWPYFGEYTTGCLKATKDIPKHTEICTTYGDGWFDER